MKKLSLIILILWLVRFLPCDSFTYEAEARDTQGLEVGALVNRDDVFLESRFVEYEPKPEEIIKKWSDFYGQDYELMKKIAFCESSLNEKAVGDSGRAKGMWQIWTIYHPIGDECAFSADCSTEWSIKQIAEGRGYWWSCYNKLN